MAAKGSGLVINIGSGLGYMNFPFTGNHASSGLRILQFVVVFAAAAALWSSATAVLYQPTCCTGDALLLG